MKSRGVQKGHQPAVSAPRKAGVVDLGWGEAGEGRVRGEGRGKRGRRMIEERGEGQEVERRGRGER